MTHLLQHLEMSLQSAVKLDLPYPERVPGDEGALASVLALFAANSARETREGGGLSLLLIRRTETVETHKGQMAFPGGMCEPEELESCDFITTALRETEEEVGISRSLVRVVGRLPVFPTVTGFRIHPVVGVLERPLEEVMLTINSAEIDTAVWIPLDVLQHPDTYKREFYPVGNARYPIHVFYYKEFRIWGATGAMIRNLLDRLSAANSGYHG